jgi:hypothetical protein
MTLVEKSFRLQSAITDEQLNALAVFANTYGLRRFQVKENGRVVTFEYDASRLRETQVSHAIRAAGIPVAAGMI